MPSSALPLLILAMLLCTSNTPAASQSTPVRRLDGSTISPVEIERTVARLMTAAHVPGLALAIINDGREVYRGTFGLRDVERRLPVTDSTVFSAMSITKGTFAFLVMLLVDDGVIALDTPISAYLPKPLPEYEKYADLAADDRWRRITPRMLLSHTAGFPNYRFLNESGKLDIKYAPGSRYAYSGEGINLMQFVVETKTGQSVGDLMRTRIFELFGMQRTSMTWRPDFASDVAMGYAANDSLIGHSRRSSPRAAGSMDSDIRDMSRLMVGLMSGTGISARSRAEMLSPQIRIRSLHQFPTTDPRTTSRDDRIQLSYGLGWGLLRTPYGLAYFKEGHDDGGANYTISFDARKTGIVIMSNSTHVESIYKELLETLIGDRYTAWEWNAYVPYNAVGKP